MTTFNFAEAMAELVRQFPVVDPDVQELAVQQVRGLAVVADKNLPAQFSLCDETDWFDNFPV